MFHSSAAAAKMPKIVGVGTANSSTAYTQQELLNLLGIEDKRTRSLFLRGTIRQRFLVLPRQGSEGKLNSESQSDLLRKHRTVGLEMAFHAITHCIKAIGAGLEDIDFLCCVTSTGFLVPSMSALLIRELGLSSECNRIDLVGMGCNAGLNGLAAAANWTMANPGKLGVLVCVEVCSAGYVLDDAIRTAVVNSLFGDGAAAAAVVAISDHDDGNSLAGPSIVCFHSHIDVDSIESMRYEWDEALGKFNFYLGPNVPYVVGANVELVVDRLLRDMGIRRSIVRHWLVHSGGKKVIDAVKVNLGLTANDLRHTSSVLRDFGNLSSGSFLFSYQRLSRELVTKPGDYGVMITMGPGTTIESALLRW